MRKALNLLLLFGPALALGFAFVSEARRVRGWRERWQQEQRDAQAWYSAKQAQDRCEAKCGGLRPLPPIALDPCTGINWTFLGATPPPGCDKRKSQKPAVVVNAKSTCWDLCEAQMDKAALAGPPCGSCEGDPLLRPELSSWRDQVEISIAKEGLIHGTIDYSRGMWHWYVYMTSAERHDALCMGNWLTPECADGPESPTHK